MTVPAHLQAKFPVTPPPSVSPSPPRRGSRRPHQQQSARTAINDVLSLFRQLQEGQLTPKECPEEDFRTFTVDEKDIEEIFRQLKSQKAIHAFVEDKVRYEIDRTCHQLRVRMPGVLHERFGRAVEKAIWNALVILPGTDSIVDNGSTNVLLKGAEASPDGSFGEETAKFPAVVLEYGRTQTAKDLKKKADRYITESEGNVRVVVCFKFEQNTASFSVYEPNDNTRRTECTVENQKFSDEAGRLVRGPSLSIKLSKFFCQPPQLQAPEPTINIRAERLFAIFDRINTQNRTVVRLNTSGGPWTRQKSSSPESLSSEREAQFADDEEGEEEEAEDGDDDYEE